MIKYKVMFKIRLWVKLLRNHLKQLIAYSITKITIHLSSSRDEQDVLNNKLSALEKKIIVGGENLLEKAEEQERMLEESAKELEERQKKEEELKKALQEKEVCRFKFW